MNNEINTKQEVKRTVWLWTVIGLAVGGWIGMIVAGIIGGIVAGVIVGILAYCSSAKNGGNAPAWLWRTKKK